MAREPKKSFWGFLFFHNSNLAFRSDQVSYSVSDSLPDSLLLSLGYIPYGNGGGSVGWKLQRCPLTKSLLFILGVPIFVLSQQLWVWNRLISSNVKALHLVLAKQWSIHISALSCLLVSKSLPGKSVWFQYKSLLDDEQLSAKILIIHIVRPESGRPG